MIPLLVILCFGGCSEILSDDEIIYEILDKDFFTYHSESLGVIKLGSNILNITAGELSNYILNLIFKSGSKVIVDFQ